MRELPLIAGLGAQSFPPSPFFPSSSCHLHPLPSFYTLLIPTFSVSLTKFLSSINLLSSLSSFPFPSTLPLLLLHNL